MNPLRRLLLAGIFVGASSFALAEDNTTQNTAQTTSQAIAPQLVLAMDRILPGATEDKVKTLLPEEARAVLNLYLAGQVQQWYFRQDRPGVVFLLRADSVESAQALVDSLPMSKAGLLAYDLVPVGPYIPLATLLNPPKPAPAKSGSKKKSN